LLPNLLQPETRLLGPTGPKKTGPGARSRGLHYVVNMKRQASYEFTTSCLLRDNCTNRASHAHYPFR